MDRVEEAPEPKPEDVQASFAATLVDEWAGGGLRAAVICPGSRSTPLALALAERPEVELQVQHDERSGGFLALGMALASGQPVAVLTTSGTATAELHPAVVEAHHAGVPLLVCTADRPPELRDVGAPQTIDQNQLYGSSVRWYADPGLAELATRDRWRPFARRVLAEANGPPVGPVQLNLPFREPLVGNPGPLPEPLPEIETELVAMQPVLSQFRLGGRGVILAGHESGPAEVVLGLAELLGWPVVADPRAQVWSPHAVLVPHLDGILRSRRARELLRPEVILRIGAPPASRVVNEWCAASRAYEIVISGNGWSDPAGTASEMHQGVPAQLVAALAEQAAAAPPPRPEGWLDQWRNAGDAAATALAKTLPTLVTPNEPATAADAVAGMPDGGVLVVSSSMPIRDVERYATPRPGLRMLSNRGANGIDGVVSTAVGVAVAAGAPTGLLIGDLAFLHDSNGLLGITHRDVDLVCVVVDNDGGGIFSFLPQAATLPGDRFERLFGTPHGLDLVALARAYGVDARTVDDDVRGAVKAAATQGGVHVLVVRTDRASNVDIHRVLDGAIATAVDTALS